jgi:hypothetical protein
MNSLIANGIEKLEATLWEAADIRYVVRGKGCVSIWISKKVLRRLAPSTPEGVPIDRLQGVTILQSDDETCVTVFQNRYSKMYRRNAGSRQ